MYAIAILIKTVLIYYNNFNQNGSNYNNFDKNISIVFNQLRLN